MDKQKRSTWAWTSLGFGIAAALVLAFSGYGYQWNWWGLGTAFTWLLPGSGILALIGFSLALFFGFTRRNNPEVSGAGITLVGVILSIAVMGTLGYWFTEAQKYPPIHDISTDIENPPQFHDIVPLRVDAPNDTTYGDQEKADLQREAYPDVETLYLDQEYGEVFDRALVAAEQMPWEEIVTKDKESGIIEAYDKLPWFGFIDDVVIRIDMADTAGHTKIDMRSVSRIGRSDIGVNAKRIRNYLNTLKKQ
jgi:uncharacterized protein (DUF1499 family)